jgi:MYXO-CTERM domain-containing protein
MLAFLSCSSTAWASPPTQVDTDPLTPAVYMGENVSPCGWPTTVAVTSGGGLCTGTLVHPRVVIYAAHCGGGGKTIRFSENAFSGGQAINASCETNPGYDGTQSTDWAYCTLNQEVNQIPLTPILYGCELDMLVPQSEIALVGFGKNTPQGGSGTKRWALTTLEAVNFAGNTTGAGGGGQPSVCPGDSGGPAFIKGIDGIWRVFGIASTVQLVDGQDCGGLATHSLASGAVPWIEEASGYDITPCHDQAGNWYPSPDCTGFFGSANNSYGNWGNWCAGTPASPPPATCGPSASSEPEENPPVVVITSPESDFESPDLPTVFDVAINASDDSGFVSVWLRINGEDILNVIDGEPPYQISNVTLPEGYYEIQGVGEDFWGNLGVSSTLTVIVGDAEPPTGDGDGDPTGGSSGEDEAGGSETTDGLTTFGFNGGGGEPSGCSCDAGRDDAMPGLVGLSLLLLTSLRRRRE